MHLYGLIGYPLGHSFSKKYFEERFVKENIPDAAFELFPLKEISEFETLIAENKSLCGLAVTIPHKEAVIPFLDETDDPVKEIGAVNCIRFSGNKKKGFNTDVIGFEKSFLPLLKPHHKKALVLGTGGASKGVQYILKKLGIEFLLVSREGSGEKVISYEAISPQVMQEYNIIINCTPVGMSPSEADQPAIPYHFLTADHLLYDLIYKPAETLFLAQGEKHGCKVKNGFEMFLIQAEANWDVWTDNEKSAE